MNSLKKHAATALAIAYLVLPALALAQSYGSYGTQYYYPPSQQTYEYPSNSYSSPYASYIPANAMPYVEYGTQHAQGYGSQYPAGYSYPSYQYPSQYYPSQYQNQMSYPNYGYGYGYSNQMNQYGEYAAEPQAYSYPSGTTGPFGTQLCYWSDYPTYAPCGKDPQQWVQDPYTGGWY